MTIYGFGEEEGEIEHEATTWEAEVVFQGVSGPEMAIDMELFHDGVPVVISGPTSVVSDPEGSVGV